MMKSRLENGYLPPHLSPGTLTCSSIYLFFFFFFFRRSCTFSRKNHILNFYFIYYDFACINLFEFYKKKKHVHATFLNSLYKAFHLFFVCKKYAKARNFE